jgi:hypothetical protein
LLRRVLPVAGAAALVLVPSTAWAVPDQGPVDHYASAGYYATADVQLPDDRHLTASLSAGYAANRSDTVASLYLQLAPPCVVVPFGWPCAPSASGWVDVTGDQVEFDRGLRGASVDDVTLTLTTPSYYLPGSGVPGGPPTGGDISPLPPTTGASTDPYTPPLGPPPFSPPPPGPSTPPVLVAATTEIVTVSLDFTGTGTVSRSAEHTVTDCGSDSTGCQSTRIAAQRTADVTVTLRWESGETTTADSGTGWLTFGQGVDVAAFLPTAAP